MYKYMACELRDRAGLAGKVLYKEATIPAEVASYVEPVDLTELVGDLTLQKLHEVFRSILKKQENKIDPVRSKFGTIEKEEVSLEDKMSYVEACLAGKPRCSFRTLLEGEAKKSKMHVIVTFLAVLELMKTGRLMVRQEETFGEIVIEAREADFAGLE